VITAGGRDQDGRPIVVLYLSEENVRRMRDGQALHVPRERMKALGLPDVAIHATIAGETQEDLERALEELKKAGHMSRVQ